VDKLFSNRNLKSDAVANHISSADQTQLAQLSPPPLQFTKKEEEKTENEEGKDSKSAPLQFDLPTDPSDPSENNDETSESNPKEGFKLDKFPDINLHLESQQATNLGALAFTQGKDIHFAPGQYKPDTVEGQKLIGHELEHVKHQKAGKVQANKSEHGFQVNDSPQLEQAADKAGDLFASDTKAKQNWSKKLNF